MTIGEINALPRDAFIRTVGNIFENSPWITEQAGGPFADANDLHAKLCDIVSRAADEQKLALIRAHPDLVGRLAREGNLTHESAREQAAAGLGALSRAESDLFTRYNAAYREKFDFPFVICARENKKDAILAAFPQRLANDRQQEMQIALREIYKIARLRLDDLVQEKGLV